MSLQEIYFIAEIVVGIAMMISIVIVAIELRQNTYIVRASMADQRQQRVNWLFKTLCTDNDFRIFHKRIDSEWDQMNDDDRYRAHCLGVVSLRSMLNELVAHFDGQISETEFRNLEWNMKFAARRPNIQSAYAFIKDGYGANVQRYWEALDKTRDPNLLTMPVKQC